MVIEKNHKYRSKIHGRTVEIVEILWDMYTGSAYKVADETGSVYFVNDFTFQNEYEALGYFTVDEKKCTCGVEKTMGNVILDFHSQWCDLIPKTAKNV